MILTDVDFWRRGAGHRARISQLVRYLSGKVYLTVMYIGGLADGSADLAASEGAYDLISLPDDKAPTGSQYLSLLKKIIKDAHFDWCIVEYIHLTLYIENFSALTRFILDLHDINSERYQSFKEYGYPAAQVALSKGQEKRIYALYDYIMVLCEPDFRSLAQMVPKKKLLLNPHPETIRERYIRKRVKSVGFVASEYLPNRDAILFFIDKCWPRIVRKHNVELLIFGNVVNTISRAIQDTTIKLKGFVEDAEEIYGQIDIVINPVRFGAGLKIKNIEALANGLPLVTTTHGARGIEEAAQKSFVLADSPDEFTYQLDELIQNYGLRKKLSRSAKKFIRDSYSPDHCFESLYYVISRTNHPAQPE